MPHELNNNIKDYLYKKFNILYHTNFLNFDCDYQILLDDLEKIKKENFDIKDKIIIEHFDTEFYDRSLRTGLHTRNVIECIRSADIPFFTIIFITSHYNFKNEISLLINKDVDGFPIVLNTVSSKYTICKKYKNIDNNSSFIEKPAVCLMAGTQRSHRSSLYYFFKKQGLFSKIAVSYKNET